MMNIWPVLKHGESTGMVVEHWDDRYQVCWPGTGTGETSSLSRPALVSWLAENGYTCPELTPTPTIGVDTAEMVAQYELNGRTYQIDHLGIGHPSQRGEYAVYCDGEQVADFLAFNTLLRREFQPPLPDTPELIVMAKAAVAEFEQE